MNTVRKLLVLYYDEIENCIDTAYHAIEQFQAQRNNAQLEMDMLRSIQDAERQLSIFRPYLPAFKQKYFYILEQHLQLGMTTRDIIMTFDRMVYELHTKLEKDTCSTPELQAWSPLMKEILDGRRAVPDAKNTATADYDLEFITSGLSVVGGYVYSRCRILQEDADFHAIKSGEILLSQMMTPDFIIVLDKVSGIVTEQGGGTCHAAVIARELNIPCIVGCGTFLDKVKNGEDVILDGDNGVLYRSG